MLPEQANLISAVNAISRECIVGKRRWLEMVEERGEGGVKTKRERLEEEGKRGKEREKEIILCVVLEEKRRR